MQHKYKVQEIKRKLKYNTLTFILQSRTILTIAKNKHTEFSFN